MTRQRGQGMAEFAACAAALMLLVLGTLALAGYQEVDRRAVVAARQTAWSQAWLGAGFDARAEARHFHDSAFTDSGVRDPHGRLALVASHQDVTLAPHVTQPGGLAATASQMLRRPLQVTGNLLGTGFDLVERGMVTGVLTTRVAPMAAAPPPFDALDLSLQARYALLADAWHAAGPAHVVQRASGLVPSSRLRAVNRIWQPLSVPLSIFEPSLRELCLGLIDPEKVPEDRLGPGRTLPAGGCP